MLQLATYLKSEEQGFGPADDGKGSCHKTGYSHKGYSHQEEHRAATIDTGSFPHSNAIQEQAIDSVAQKQVVSCQAQNNLPQAVREEKQLCDI